MIDAASIDYYFIFIGDFQLLALSKLVNETLCICFYYYIALTQWSDDPHKSLLRSFALRRQNSICNRLEMTTKLSHPYKDHPEPWQWPKEYTDDIEEIYEWFALSHVGP